MRPRASYLGGPDIAAITGNSAYAGPRDVFIKKAEGAEVESTPAMEWGRRLERAIAEKWADETGHKLEQGQTVFHPAHDFLGGTPDFLASDDPNLLLECKTASGRQLSESYDPEGMDPYWGEEGTDIVPRDYFVQCQWYMGLTGRRRADLAVVFKNYELSFRIYHIKFDPRFYEWLEKRGAAFWQSFVVPRVMPPEHTRSDLVTTYFANRALQGGLEVQAAPIQVELARRLESVSSQIKELEAEQDEIKGKLLAQMADDGAKKIKGAIDGAAFSVSIRSGGESKPVVLWEQVAHELAQTFGLQAVPDDLINLFTVQGKPRKPYLTTYFNNIRKARAASGQTNEETA